MWLSLLVKVKITAMCEELAPIYQVFLCQVFFGHSVQHLRSGTLNLVKLGYLITVIRNIHISLLLYFSQVHVSGITDTEEERIKEAAAYIAQRNLLAREEGVTAAKQSTVSKQSTSMLRQEEGFEKSRKVAIREKAEHLSLKKTVKKKKQFNITYKSRNVTTIYKVDN